MHANAQVDLLLRQVGNAEVNERSAGDFEETKCLRLLVPKSLSKFDLPKFISTLTILAILL